MSKLKINLYILILFFIFNNVSANMNKTFYDFKINTIDGSEMDLSKFKNKPFLLVNVASKCGFTKQYSDLQSLYELYKDKGLIVLAVPSNQFGGQEPGTNSEIKNFCETNFNITFPITAKFDVKGEKAHPIYLWAKDTYGRSTIPKWNFHKILINKDGKVEDTFASFTNPMSTKITKKIDRIIK